MQRLVFGTIITAFLAIGCGGGDSGISIVGKTPEAQAQEVAEAACEQQAECGQVNVECDSDGAGGFTCTGTIEPVDYQMCYDEFYPGLLEEFQSCDLTEDLERKLQTCYNAILNESCVTQAEVDAWVAELEAGNFDAELRPLPSQCDTLDEIDAHCESQQ